MKETLGIIIPVYNEGENIEKTINAIEAEVSGKFVISIVYDFDEDNTLPVVRELKKSKKEYEIKLLKNPEGGVLNAIKTGLEKSTEDYLLVTMADLSDDYSVVDSMGALMSEGYDIVCGSRYMKGGRQMGGPIIKRTMSRLAGLSLKYLVNFPTHDVTNSFKLYRKEMLKSIMIESTGGFEIGMEIVIKAHFSGYKVTEVPCTWTDREEGESRFKITRWTPKYLKWYLYAIQSHMGRKKV